MNRYTIDVSLIEELQMINNKEALNKIFFKATERIVGGDEVILARITKGSMQAFDSITTEADLAAYKERVFKYLK
jgi:hypothetical protein